MKKMLKISLVAVLAVAPLLAHGAAANVDKEPTHAATASAGNVALAGPQYALQPASATDSNVATAGYVKGAYNAAIKAVNKVAADVADINADLTNVATQDGVVATINNASVSYTPAGAVDGVTIDAMNEWGSDTPGSVTIPGGTFRGTAATISPQVNTYDSGETEDEGEGEGEH